MQTLHGGNKLITHVSQIYNTLFFLSLHGKTAGEEPPEKAKNVF